MSEMQVVLQYWDPTGDSQPKNMRDSFLAGAVAAVLCYDLNDLTTFEKLDDWFSYAQQKGSDHIKLICLVGTKADLGQQVTSDQIDTKVAEWQAKFNISYATFISSAKTGLSTDAIHQYLVMKLSKIFQDPDNSSQDNLLFKVVICGELGVGKTSLKSRIIGRQFASNYMMTIGADFSVKRETVSLDALENFTDTPSSFSAASASSTTPSSPVKSNIQNEPQVKISAPESVKVPPSSTPQVAPKFEEPSTGPNLSAPSAPKVSPNKPSAPPNLSAPAPGGAPMGGAAPAAGPRLSGAPEIKEKEKEEAERNETRGFVGTQNELFSEVAKQRDKIQDQEEVISSSDVKSPALRGIEKKEASSEKVNIPSEESAPANRAQASLDGLGIEQATEKGGGGGMGIDALGGLATGQADMPVSESDQEASEEAEPLPPPMPEPTPEPMPEPVPEAKPAPVPPAEPMMPEPVPESMPEPSPEPIPEAMSPMPEMESVADEADIDELLDVSLAEEEPLASTELLAEEAEEEETAEESVDFDDVDEFMDIETEEKKMDRDLDGKSIQEEEYEVVTEQVKQVGVDYFDRMVPAKHYPLTVTISTETIEKIRKKVKIMTGERQSRIVDEITLTEETEFIRIVPMFPGCLVAPAEHIVDVTEEDQVVQFYVTPLVYGKIEESIVQFWGSGKLLGTIKTPTKVSNPWISRIIALSGVIASSFPKFIQASGLGLQDLPSFVIFSQSVDLLLFLIVPGTAVSLGAALFYRRMTRPRKSIASDRDNKVFATG